MPAILPQQRVMPAGIARGHGPLYNGSMIGRHAGGVAYLLIFYAASWIYMRLPCP